MGEQVLHPRTGGRRGLAASRSSHTRRFRKRKATPRRAEPAAPRGGCGILPAPEPPKRLRAGWQSEGRCVVCVTSLFLLSIVNFAARIGIVRLLPQIWAPPRHNSNTSFSYSYRLRLCISPPTAASQVGVALRPRYPGEFASTSRRGAESTRDREEGRAHNERICLASRGDGLGNSHAACRSFRSGSAFQPLDRSCCD
jgi:hypothetical protein